MLAEHPLYSKLARVLTLSDVEAVAVRAIPVHSVSVKADQVISRAGDRPSQSCLVAEGMACTSKVAGGGKRQIMTLHIQGDAPDLHSLHLKVLDSDIWAITDCQLAYMAHKELRALNRKHPRLGEDLWRTTLVEGAIYREWIVNVGQRGALSRVAHLFCEMMLRSEEAGLGRDGTCPLPITQADLAEITGMSDVHVNRTLRTLRERDLINFGKGSLTIYNWPALVELGDFRSDYLHLLTDEVTEAA